MADEKRLDLYSEKFFRKLVSLLREYRYVIWGSMIIGLLAYTFAFTNKIPNHDDLSALFYKGTSSQSGRFGLIWMAKIFPNYSMPWIYGILSLIISTIGNCLIVRMFRIKTPLLQFLLGGLVISFPSQIGIFAYMFTASSYSVAYLLAVWSVSLLTGEKKRYIPLAILALIGSLSIYQGYLATAVSLSILYLIQRLLLNQGNAKELFFRGVLYVVFFLIALGLYWGLSEILWKLSGSGMGAYASNALALGKSSLLDGAKNAYKNFLRIIFLRKYALIPSETSQKLHYLTFLLLGIELLVYLFCKQGRGKKLLLLFLLAVLPLGINCIYLIVAEGSVHTLVLMSFTAIYILFAILIEYGQIQVLARQVLNKVHALMMDVCVAAMAVIILINVYTANEAYLNMHLAYENTYSLASSVLTQLQSTPGYTSDSKVVLVGTYQRPSYYTQYFSNITGLMGVQGITPGGGAIRSFFSYYMGMPLNWATQDELNMLLETEEVSQMPCYPNHGYISQVEDIFVIKFSQ